jgi:hypothetical protein
MSSFAAFLHTPFKTHTRLRQKALARKEKMVYAYHLSADAHQRVTTMLPLILIGYLPHA